MITRRRQRAPGLATNKVAAERFDRIADVSRQMELVQLAVVQHGEQMKRGHPDLAMVTAGYRARRIDGHGYAIHPEPCVLLTVHDKWPSGGTPAGAVELPKRLQIRVPDGGKMQDFAVPTDVQDMKWLSGVTPQRASSIEMNITSRPHGALTCVVSAAAPSGARNYALSALHVLSPMPPMDRTPPQGLQFSQTGHGMAVGRTAPFGGCMRSDGPSFDVQLAEVTPSCFAAAFAGLPKGPVAFAQSRADVDEVAHTSQFLVLVPTNGPGNGPAGRPPVYGQFSGYADQSFEIEYKVSNNGSSFTADFFFDELIVLAAGMGQPVTLAGDSGSAVIAVSGGQALLVGMLIAGPAPGSGSDRMVVLPTWLIFDPRRWPALPPGTQALVPGF